MTRLFTIHEVEEMTPVQYVGVYTLNWRPEWGAPTAMFAPVDDPVYDAAPELLEACRTALFELRHAHEMADDCYEHCDATTKTMLDKMLPVRKNDGAIDTLTAAIAQAEGGAQ